MITDSVKEYIVNTSGSIMASELQKLATPAPCTSTPCNGGGTGDGGGGTVTPTIIIPPHTNELLGIFKEYILDSIDTSVEFVNSPELGNLDQETLDAIIDSTVLADLQDPNKTSILSDSFTDFALLLLQDPAADATGEKALIQKLIQDSRHDYFFGKDTAQLFENIHLTVNDVSAIAPDFTA